MRLILTFALLLLIVGCNVQSEPDAGDVILNVDSLDSVKYDVPTLPDTLKERDPEFTNEHPRTVLFTVDITGVELEKLTFEEVADLWDIDPDDFLAEIIETFRLKGIYCTDSIIESIYREYDVRPVLIKQIAEEMKNS